MNLKEFIGTVAVSVVIAVSFCWLVFAWSDQSYNERERVVEQHKAKVAELEASNKF